jgi:hypothetical protein
VELLLNLVWAIIALVVLSAFWLQRKQQCQRAIPRLISLVAVVTALLIIFPVISIDDDLYPVIGSLEDSAKRTLQAPVSFHHSQDAPATTLLTAILLLQSLLALVRLQDRLDETTTARFLEWARMPRDGRSPPLS